MAQAGNLLKKPGAVIGRCLRIDHCAMQAAYQAGKKQIAVAKIDHHQRNGRKQYADNQNIKLYGSKTPSQKGARQKIIDQDIGSS